MCLAFSAHLPLLPLCAGGFKYLEFALEVPASLAGRRIRPVLFKSGVWGLEVACSIPALVSLCACVVFVLLVQTGTVPMEFTEFRCFSRGGASASRRDTAAIGRGGAAARRRGGGVTSAPFRRRRHGDGNGSSSSHHGSCLVVCCLAPRFARALALALAALRAWRSGGGATSLAPPPWVAYDGGGSNGSSSSSSSSAQNDFAVRAAVARARDTTRACRLVCAIGTAGEHDTPTSVLVRPRGRVPTSESGVREHTPHFRCSSRTTRTRTKI